MLGIPDPVAGSCLQPPCNKLCDLGWQQLTRLWQLRSDLDELNGMLNRFRREVLKKAEDEHLKAAVEAAVAEQSNDALDALSNRRTELHRVADLYCYALDDVEDWNAVLSMMCLGRVDLRCKITCGVSNLKQKVMNELEKLIGGTATEELTAKFVESKLNPETTSIMSESFHGRAKEVSALIVRLLSGGGSCDAIPIVGMGGIGKSALARQAFNSGGVEGHFDHRIWVFVPYSGFDMCKVGKKIVEIIDIDTPGTSSREPTTCSGQEGLLRLVQQRLKGKRILLVLDGVWCVEPTRWKEMMKVLAEVKEGSKILVTTQKDDVVRAMEVCNNNVVCLDVLPEDWCRFMFSVLASYVEAAEKIDQASLETIRESFVYKCNGLPLVAKDLVDRMRRCNVIDKREWEKVVNADLSKAKHNIFAPFLLSYCQLSVLQKRCFSLCSIFPINYEIQVDDLVAMWISLIHSMKLEGNLEDEALSCFDALRDRNMFRDFSKDYEGNVVKCKMHDAVREFARVFTKRNTDEPNTSQWSDEARYSSLVLEANKDRIPIDDTKNLHVLFVHRLEASTSPNPLSCDALGKLPRLWTLHMHQCNISQLPDALDKLLHLRYLNLSGNPLTGLPESLCDLFNLLTLRLKDCSQLQSLPNEIGRLKKLRHLYIAGCSSLTLLPRGILECTELRVLDTFVVADDQMREALRLGDLNNFTHLLRKIICIYRCGNLTTADLSSEAAIYRYHDLKLNFEGSVGTSGGRQEAIVEAIVEKLEPTSELKSLEVRGFYGSVLRNRSMESLDNLKRVVLRGCQNLTSLTTLGKMLRLECLHIDSMANVQKVDLEFLETTSDGDKAVSFPRLKELRFDELPSWTEWTDVRRSSVMPCLISLKISGCSSLQELPKFLWTITVLRDLEMDGCHESLKQHCLDLGPCNSSCAQGFHIPNIKINGEIVRSQHAIASSSNGKSTSSSS